MRMPLLVLSLAAELAGSARTCPQVLNGTCLASSLPILRTINTTSVSTCCNACVANKNCASWTINLHSKKCFIRQTALPPNSGHCTSGVVRAPTPSPLPPRPPANAPNVLLILVDDLRPWMPSYGAPEIRAPNLVKLASSSVQFNNSYVQQAICSPTRNSFMSGRRPDHTRLWNFKGSFRSNGIDSSGKPGAAWRSLPQVFKENGWITAGCGKTFHPGSPPNWDSQFSWSTNSSSTKPGTLLFPYVDPDEQIYSFDTSLTRAQQAGNLDAQWGTCCSMKQTLEAPHCNGTLHNRTTVCDLAAEETTDVQTAAVAIQNLEGLVRLQRQRRGGDDGNDDYTGRPFFLAAGFHKPHPYWPLPMSLQKSYIDLPLPRHRLAPVGMPDVAFVSCDWLQMTDDVGADVLSGHGILPNTSLTDALTRKVRAGYAAGVTWMDMQVGKLLDRVDTLGVANNTIVAFTGDHGWGLGENGIWCKYTVFENQVRVPLFIRVPWWGALHGTSSDGMVELVDLFPTLADLAGILPQVLGTEALDGDSLVPLLRPSTATATAAAVAAAVAAAATATTDTTAATKATLWQEPFAYAFSQYPRCMDSPLAKEPPYTPNRDACAGREPRQFTHMGLSVRSRGWRYTEWRRWNGSSCAPDWSFPPQTELYDHRADDTPGCFDCFEHVNLAADAMHADVVKNLTRVLEDQFKKDGDKATGCPEAVSDGEYAAVDMTGERRWANDGKEALSDSEMRYAKLN